MTTITGRCHCGNLDYVLETGLPIGQLGLRACQCSFCRRHGARCTSDPKGQARITIRDPENIKRYQFDLRTADFLVCGACGVYIGAVLTAQGKSYATFNINAADQAADFTQEALAVSYDAESEAERRARRAANWTPVAEIVEGAP